MNRLNGNGDGVEQSVRPRRIPERDQQGQEPSGETSYKWGPELEGQRREEVFRGRQETAEQMRNNVD